MMKNKYKLAIFDIDGTLIERGVTTILPSAVEAIHAIQEQRTELLIATGRAYYFIQDDIHAKINPDYYVTVNGSTVFDLNHDVIHEVTMPREEVNALITYARENKLGIGLKMRDDMRIYSDYRIFTDVYLQGSPKAHILKDYTEAPLIEEGAECPAGIFMMGNEELIEASAPLSPDSKYAKAYTDAYDVYSLRSGKMKGIEVVLERLNISWDEVITFGDAANDIDMLEAAYTGVAMGDAPDHVKESADFVTKDLEHDGIAYAIQTLILND